MTRDEALTLTPGTRVVLVIDPQSSTSRERGVAPFWVDEVHVTPQRQIIVRIRDRADPADPARDRMVVLPEVIDRPPAGALWDEPRRVWIDRTGAQVLPPTGTPPAAVVDNMLPFRRRDLL